MKILQTKTTTLNSKEFSQVSDKIIDALYRLVPDISDLYDIHINFIDDAWRIDFLPLDRDDLPVLNIDTHTEHNGSGIEFLKIVPVSLTDIPGKIKFKKSEDVIRICDDYITIMTFIQELQEFKYRLS